MIQVNTLKLDNKVIILHSAYGSFGGVEDGPNTVIDCFLNAGCTIALFLPLPTTTMLTLLKQGKAISSKRNEFSHSYQDALQGLSLTKSFEQK